VRIDQNGQGEWRCRVDGYYAALKFITATTFLSTQPTEGVFRLERQKKRKESKNKDDRTVKERRGVEDRKRDTQKGEKEAKE
jgi:hypothetical protein